MYGYESWTAKKAEHQRIDAFELWGSRDLSSKSGTQVLPASPHQEPLHPVHSGWAGDHRTKDVMDQTLEKEKLR